MNAAERDFYTVPEAAERLAVSPSTIWRWIKAGKLPAYRVGERAIRIKREDLGAVITPLRPDQVPDQDIWVGYDPEKAREALMQAAGALRGLDTERFIREIHEAREQGPNRDFWTDDVPDR